MCRTSEENTDAIHSPHRPHASENDRVCSPSSKYSISPDRHHLHPAPGTLHAILSERLAAARRYYQEGFARKSEEGKKGRIPEDSMKAVAFVSNSTADPLSISSSSCSASSSTESILSAFPLSAIRNVSVVAHVDHGKTTLTDAMLRWSGLLPSESAVGTFTDRLPVERERGITIKAQTCSIVLEQYVRVDEEGATSSYRMADAYPPSRPSSSIVTGKYILLNLVDTPGHADFQYEVSRSLHATEGALLLVDANQGVEAQTIAQFFAVLEREGQIVPVLTKMDAVTSDDRVDKTLAEMGDSMGMLGLEEVLLTSAKQKAGIEAVFQAIIDRVPPPVGKVGYSDWCQLPLLPPSSPQRQEAEQTLVPLRALVFDCWTAESGGMMEPSMSSGMSYSTVVSDPSKMDAADVMRRHTSMTGGTPPSSSSSTVGSIRGGIYCLVRVVDGTLTAGTPVVLFHHPHLRPKVVEVGFIHPTLYPSPALTAGMVGYVLVTGISKEEVRVGETLCTTLSSRYVLASEKKEKETKEGGGEMDCVAPTKGSLSVSSSSSSTPPPGLPARMEIQPIPGFRFSHPPVVFAGLFPDDDNFITHLRESVTLLCLNDPAVSVKPIQCPALGPGLQLGFLGLLHLQVFIDRLLQEFSMPVLVTPPQVQYMYVGVKEDPANTAHHKPLTVENWRWRHEGVGAYLEPVVCATVVTPLVYFDVIHQAALTTYRGIEENVQGLDDGRMAVRYSMPLGDLARGFFTIVKSLSHGYASLDYDQLHYVEASVVKVDVVVNNARIGALSFISLQHEAAPKAKKVLQSLKVNIPRCSVDLPIQALIGQKVVARETIKAYRKDVTAKIHAGDISRKQKKWNDQKKGKKRMAKRTVGTVVLDQSVLSAAMGATMLGGSTTSSRP